MLVFINAFWSGFLEKTDGVHFGIFQTLLSKVFDQAVYITKNIEEANILLESSFGESVLLNKKWTYSIFFSGEGGIHTHKIPSNSNQYTIILGSQKTETNFVSCPLYILYDLCSPYEYQKKIFSVPKKDICAIISNDNPQLYRNEFINKLENAGFHIDMAGKYKNNIGYLIAGDYTSINLINFMKEYKIVLSLENSQLDDYITEKIINPIRAGTIPLYYGSNHINEYINQERFIKVNSTNLESTFTEIHHLLTDNRYWLEKANKSPFIKTSESHLEEISLQMKILIYKKPFYVELISNYELEKDRHEDIDKILTLFNIKPTYECYGETAKDHPLFNKFAQSVNLNARSLAINHIYLLKKYINKNAYLVIFESDVIQLFNDTIIEYSIIEDIDKMQKYDIDYIFLGMGCFGSFDSYDKIAKQLETVSNPIKENLPFKEIEKNLFCVNKSRCTESYIISPKGIQKFLEWFYNNKEHMPIDFAFNLFFDQVPNTIGCWRYPELFKQGSCINKYKSLVQL
jgi:hypothetical protein